jgi:Mrp family chromosome partitioning ATPase/capsular polysaccharide biosynthesis protein
MMPNDEPTLVSSAWRHRWMVLVIVGLTIALTVGFYFVGPQEVRYEASATVVIQEPMQSDASTTASNNQQYIAAQVEIIRSPVVADAANAITNEAGIDVSTDDLVKAVEIVATSGSPLVTINANAPSSKAAITYANAMAEGYRQVMQRQRSATSEAQLERIDAQVQNIDKRLSEIGDELTALIADQPGLESLRQQAQDSVEAIAQLQIELQTATGTRADQIRQEIEDHRQNILVYSEVSDASPAGPEQQALLEEQSRQVDRRATLLTLRDEVAVDAGLAPDAIALVQEAAGAEPQTGLGLARTLAVALIVGLALGVTVAYFRTVSRRKVTDRSEPEPLLGVPMLTDVPDFETERLESKLPVRDHPRSAAAEAYRFAATSIIAAGEGEGIHSVLVVSPTLGQGKTTTVVNVALAAAINGRSTLVLDCDFGNQQSSSLLLGENHTRLPGMTDVIEGAATRTEAVHEVDLGNDAVLSVMPRGTRPSLASSVFESGKSRSLFLQLIKTYDLVLIDGPPLLQVAYASVIARLAQGLVVVVGHGGRQSEIVDLRDRLGLIGTPILGYVYNRSPLRREMTMSEGSMMDILGDSAFESKVEQADSMRSG